MDWGLSPPRGLTGTETCDKISITMKIVIDTEQVLEPAEAAKQIGIGYATIYRWMKSGKIIAIYVSGKALIPKSEIARLEKEIENPRTLGVGVSKWL